LTAVLVSTSPPFCGVAGVIVSLLRSVPLKYWVMDLNPDQVVAMGLMASDAIAVQIFDLWNRWVLARASDVVVLDRFMLDRVCYKHDVRQKAMVLPPWPQVDFIENVRSSANLFRRQHVPDGKFVLMYSGNHSKASPLATILDAVEQMRDDPRLLVLCVGGGQSKHEIDERIARGANNLMSLPYQPLEEIKYSLSAADVHLVALGDPMVGIIHPCKVYSAMAVSRPILYVGPSPSHISDWIDRYDIGWQVRQGDVDAAVKVLRTILQTPQQVLESMGNRANQVMLEHLNPKNMLSQFCDVVERGIDATFTRKYSTDSRKISTAVPSDR
jgi:glycosyltransferase involved in cell wall biosynthesis